jgi:hypothetical protein
MTSSDNARSKIFQVILYLGRTVFELFAGELFNQKFSWATLGIPRPRNLTSIPWNQCSPSVSHSPNGRFSDRLCLQDVDTLANQNVTNKLSSSSFVYVADLRGTRVSQFDGTGNSLYIDQMPLQDRLFLFHAYERIFSPKTSATPAKQTRRSLRRLNEYMAATTLLWTPDSRGANSRCSPVGHAPLAYS